MNQRETARYSKIAVFGARKPTRGLSEVNALITNDCLKRLVGNGIFGPYFCENENGVTVSETPTQPGKRFFCLRLLWY